jgi:hypothetical protein
MNKFKQTLRTIVRHELETEQLIVRYLVPSDLDQLIALENKKWEESQAASKETLLKRIKKYPQLSIGAFDKNDESLKASLFMKPITKSDLQTKYSWDEFAECGDETIDEHTQMLFGTSLSSCEPSAVQAILHFFLPQAIKGGWQQIYLGLPIPGFQRWLLSHPQGSVHEYVHSTRRGLPLDPQLRHYHKMGFKKILAIKPDYFPHEGSLNNGVFISADIPLSHIKTLRWLPAQWLQTLASWFLARPSPINNIG